MRQRHARSPISVGPQGNSWGGIGRQHRYGILDTIAHTGINQQTPDGFPIYAFLGSSEMAPAGSAAQTPEEQLSRDMGPATLFVATLAASKLSRPMAGTERASGELETVGGKRGFGNSTGSSASGGVPRAPMNPTMQQALDLVKTHAVTVPAVRLTL